MNFCLSQKEFPLFFEEYLARGTNLDNSFDDDLQIKIDGCMNWEDNIGIVLYMFTHFLQKKIKSENDPDSKYIPELFELNNVGNFILEPLDRNFIIYMLDYSRPKIKEDLTDTLVLILQNYLDHSYDSSFCF